MKPPSSPIRNAGILFTLAAAGLAAPPAGAQTLYNGTPGSTPGSQGWLALGNINTSAPATTATETYNSVGGYTTLDSSVSNAIYAGYSNYNLLGSQVNSNFPTLSNVQGFTLNFAVQVNEENVVPTSSSANPRAGLSVILLDSQHQGIEIGFDTNSIFSQASDFSSASEFVSSILPNSVTNYALTIQGSTYALASGGTTLMTGAIKQYSGSGALANLVYNESNLVFIGDDTTSDGGSFNVQSVAITSGTAAPEPADLAMLPAGLFAATMLRRRRPRR